MSDRALLVTARLAGPLAGDPPKLDALLLFAMAQHVRKPEDRSKVDRSLPCPPQGEIPLPLAAVRLGPWLVYSCSDPILPRPALETVEFVNKRVSVEHAALLVPSERGVLSTSSGWTKSYRLPLRVRPVPCVRWFVVGDRREVLKLLKRVTAIGKKVADGYGRVAAWEAIDAAEDWSWFARRPAGHVLMRVLPAGPWLPDDMLGARRDFGACTPPYWHPERYGEIFVPC